MANTEIDMDIVKKYKQMKQDNPKEFINATRRMYYNTHKETLRPYHNQKSKEFYHKNKEVASRKALERYHMKKYGNLDKIKIKKNPEV